MAAFLLVILGIAYQGINLEKELSPQVRILQQKAISLETEVNSLSTKINSLKTQIETLEDKIDTQNKRLDKFFELFNIDDEFEVTAYAPFDNVSGICTDDNPEVTATGVRPGPGVMAVNPEIIPYGSLITIFYPDGTIEQGYALDTGGALRREGVKQIDVFRHTYTAAMAHGRRSAVVIYEKGEV